MLKRVEEDWSFFNRAVRERAEGQPRQETPPLKLVTPVPPSAPDKPAPPAPPPVQPPSAATAAPASTSRSQTSMGRAFDFIIKLLLGTVAIVLLIALLEAASRNAHSTNPAAPGAPANGTAGTGGAEKVVTDYTTFNTVVYRSWKVVTGWKFANSRTTQPDLQYCYLEVLTPGGQQSYTIEERVPVGRHDMPKALIPGLDKAAWEEAATKCVWRH